MAERYNGGIVSSTETSLSVLLADIECQEPPCGPNLGVCRPSQSMGLSIGRKGETFFFFDVSRASVGVQVCESVSRTGGRIKAFFSGNRLGNFPTWGCNGLGNFPRWDGSGM